MDAAVTGGFVALLLSSFAVAGGGLLVEGLVGAGCAAGGEPAGDDAVGVDAGALAEGVVVEGAGVELAAGLPSSLSAAPSARRCRTGRSSLLPLSSITGAAYFLVVEGDFTPAGSHVPSAIQL